MSDTPPTPPESPPPASPEAEPSGSPSAGDDRSIAMLAHLISLSGFVIPFGNIIGPLIILMTQQQKSAFVVDQAKESLNFQITVTIAALLCIPLIFVCVGIPLMAAIGVADLVFIIIAAIAANGGQSYRYPFALRLVK